MRIPIPGDPRFGSVWNFATPWQQSRDAVWMDLRSLRSQPPGGASGNDKRRLMFNAALDQAEQLFGAAADTGFASRPLLLFYGLSQAGRAIAAAARAAGPGDWKLSDHGIAVPDLNRRVEMRDVVVRDKGIGSFTQLASILGSGTLGDGVPLGQVWVTIPELTLRPLMGSTSDLRPALFLNMTGVAGAEGYFGELSVFPSPWSQPPPEPKISEFLARYPSLAGQVEPEPGHALAPILRGDPPRLDIQRAWPAPNDGPVSGSDLERQLTVRYRGDDDRWAFPVLGAATQPLHPLLSWWAVLYTLSMLARYEPGIWAGHLDIDRSNDAVPVANALNVALDACPQLVLHAIRTVSL